MMRNVKYLLRRKTSVSVPALILLTFIFILLITIILEPSQQHIFADARLKIFGNEISCYRENMESLRDISDEIHPPHPDKGIFFHETSCESFLNGRIVLTPRQACAVESAALLHPNRTVYLLFTSPGIVKFNFWDETDSILAALQSYSNIWIGHLNFSKYIANTPLEHLYSGRSIELSKYAGSHASDVLRYLTLWKYGGIYLDLDVIVTKSFNNLGSNFAGSESNENVAAGILSISKFNPGHIWAENCLEDLSQTFTGSEWGYNGPGVITRLLQKLCNAQKAIEMTDNCQGFKVLTPSAFYPIPWWDWTKYFNENVLETTLKQVQDSYAIHVWNKHSKNAKVENNSAYAVMAAKFCPKVYKSVKIVNF